MAFGKLVKFSAAAAFMLSAIQAHAQTVVNVSAQSSIGNTLFLDAGSYDFSFIGTAQGGAYDAGNAWADVAGCDGAGANCSRGWLNALFIDLGNTSGVFDRTNGFAFWPDNAATTPYYATPGAAITAATTGGYTVSSLAGGSYSAEKAPFSLNLQNGQEVNFFIKDSNYSDNQGGVSLALSKVAAVPEPATWAMMFVGFGLLGAVMRRRRMTDGATYQAIAA